jgi:hypothetical protein
MCAGRLIVKWGLVVIGCRTVVETGGYVRAVFVLVSADVLGGISGSAIVPKYPCVFLFLRGELRNAWILWNIGAYLTTLQFIA